MQRIPYDRQLVAAFDKLLRADLHQRPNGVEHLACPGFSLTHPGCIISKRLPVTRFSALADLSSTEAAALKGLADSPVHIERGGVIRSEGQEPNLFVLLDGWAAASGTSADGSRQYYKIHLPGDMMGAPSLPFDKATETLSVLTDAIVSRISLPALGRIFVETPRIGALFFLTANEERVILMDRLTSIGRRGATQRLAALLVHLDERLSLIDAERPGILHLPLTQEQIGDLIGLTAVHVNRVFRRLKYDGVIAREGRAITIPSRNALRRVAGIGQRSIARNPSWLPQSS